MGLCNSTSREVVFRTEQFDARVQFTKQSFFQCSNLAISSVDLTIWGRTFHCDVVDGLCRTNEFIEFILSQQQLGLPVLYVSIQSARNVISNIHKYIGDHIDSCSEYEQRAYEFIDVILLEMRMCIACIELLSLQNNLHPKKYKQLSEI